MRTKTADRPLGRPSKIPVLHIADKFGVRGASAHGVSRLFCWWFARFDSRYQAKLVGLRPWDETFDNLQSAGIDVISLNRSKFDVSTIPAIVRLIRKEGAQIVHLHGYGSSTFGRIAARWAGVRAIVHEHMVDPALPAYQVPFDYSLAPWTDYAIAISGSVKEFMVRKRYLPEKKTEVVFNGAPLGDFKRVVGPALVAAREKWGLREGDIVLGSVGRLDEEKGNKYLLEAVALLHERWPRLKLLLIGDGPHLERLTAQGESLGISDHLIFTGFQREIPLLQSLLTIQVFPSLGEGGPLTLYEAMAMRLPIVATTVGGLGEVLRDNYDARMAPPHDSKGLAEAIEDLIAHPEKAERLAGQASLASPTFDIQRTVNRIQEIYEELAGGRVRPGS
jgi:glycosyltransferase involved in cell wall biosynthesis